jgi:hypothetical protein
MRYQKHGHREMWPISTTIVETSPDIEVPDTIDEDPHTRDSEREPHFTVGTSERERRAPQ